jgi:hypothetical protein
MRLFGSKLETLEPDATAYQNLMRQNPILTRGMRLNSSYGANNKDI